MGLEEPLDRILVIFALTDGSRPKPDIQYSYATEFFDFKQSLELVWIDPVEGANSMRSSTQ